MKEKAGKLLCTSLLQPLGLCSRRSHRTPQHLKITHVWKELSPHVCPAGLPFSRTLQRVQAVGAHVAQHQQGPSESHTNPSGCHRQSTRQHSLSTGALLGLGNGAGWVLLGEKGDRSGAGTALQLPRVLLSLPSLVTPKSAPQSKRCCAAQGEVVGEEVGLSCTWQCLLVALCLSGLGSLGPSQSYQHCSYLLHSSSLGSVTFPHRAGCTGLCQAATALLSKPPSIHLFAA